MLLKTIQWNIGGGKIRKVGDPGSGPYAEEGIEYIADILRNYDADIVTLQETHATSIDVQANILAQKIGLPYVINDIYADSHLEEGCGLGQAIISHFPIHEHEFTFFPNPHFEMLGPHGKPWISHDKGVSKCMISIGEGRKLQVATLHLIPFRKFGVSLLDEALKDLGKDIARLAHPSHTPFLLQGDFNIDDSLLRAYLPDLFNHEEIAEIPLKEPTTPKGRKYDHIVFQEMEPLCSSVISDVLTDHYPIYSEFNI